MNPVFQRNSKTLESKRFFLITAAPDVPENYLTVKKLWINLGLQKLDCKFTNETNLKLCNILLGMMSHNSSYPCYWCNIKKEGEPRREGKQRTIANLNSGITLKLDRM